jgi:hypothetical protein
MGRVLIHGVRRSPSKANVADRIAQHDRDIERRAESAVRHDEFPIAGDDPGPFGAGP